MIYQKFNNKNFLKLEMMIRITIGPLKDGMIHKLKIQIVS